MELRPDGIILTEDEAFDMVEIISALSVVGIARSRRDSCPLLTDKEFDAATGLIAHGAPFGLARVDSGKTQLLTTELIPIAAQLASIAVENHESAQQLLATSTRPEASRHPSSAHQLGLQASAFRALATAARLKEMVLPTE